LSNPAIILASHAVGDQEVIRGVKKEFLGLR